jgi:hypothetical protein
MYGKKWGLRPTYTTAIRPSICHAALFWWVKVKQKSAKTQLGRIQRMNGLSSYHWGHEIDPYCSNGSATKSGSSRSLDHGGGEHGTQQTANIQQRNIPRTVSGLPTIWKNVGDPLLDMPSGYIIPAYHYTKNSWL